MQLFLWCILPASLLLTCGPLVISCTKIKGSLSYSPEENNLFFFLTRFGVGKGHEMYAYGKVEADTSDFIGFNSLMTLVLIPQGTWDDFSNADPQYYGPNRCNHMITTVLNESVLVGGNKDHCAVNGTADYLRMVPCDHSDGKNYKSCNQPPSVGVVGGNDFTYVIASAPRTEYYYLLLMYCTRNVSGNSSDCQWGSADKISIRYDISLVNSLPNESNPYTNEFPYDLQGTLSLHLVFVISYFSLVVIHFILHSRLCVKGRYNVHILIKVFSVSLVLEFIYVFLELLHSSIYAGNGQGVIALKYLGEVANQLSDWLLILVVILVGKGWQVTTSSLRWSKVTMIIWGNYIIFSGIFFMWMVISEQVYPLNLSFYFSYQSWAGGLYLLYRLFVLVYLLYEMRQVYMIEIRPAALWLYIILAVGYIIWFCYLPLLTVVALLINPLRRLLVMSSLYFLFDFLINLGMVALFCPRWANLFFQFNNYINLLSQYTYKSLKSYGGGSTDSTPI